MSIAKLWNLLITLTRQIQRKFGFWNIMTFFNGMCLCGSKSANFFGDATPQAKIFIFATQTKAHLTNGDFLEECSQKIEGF